MSTAAASAGRHEPVLHSAFCILQRLHPNRFLLLGLPRRRSCARFVLCSALLLLLFLLLLLLCLWRLYLSPLRPLSLYRPIPPSQPPPPPLPPRDSSSSRSVSLRPPNHARPSITAAIPSSIARPDIYTPQGSEPRPGKLPPRSATQTPPSPSRGGLYARLSHLIVLRRPLCQLVRRRSKCLVTALQRNWGPTSRRIHHHVPFSRHRERNPIRNRSSSRYGDTNAPFCPLIPPGTLSTPIQRTAFTHHPLCAV